MTFLIIDAEAELKKNLKYFFFVFKPLKLNKIIGLKNERKKNKYIVFLNIKYNF